MFKTDTKVTLNPSRYDHNSSPYNSVRQWRQQLFLTSSTVDVQGTPGGGVAGGAGWWRQTGAAVGTLGPLCAGESRGVVGGGGYLLPQIAWW